MTPSPNQKLVSACCGANIITTVVTRTGEIVERDCSKCHQPCGLVREGDKSFISITGLEVNNPNICIRGNSTFACICPACVKHSKSKHEEFNKLFNDIAAKQTITSSDTNREVPHPMGKVDYVKTKKELIGYNCRSCHGANIRETDSVLIHFCEGLLEPFDGRKQEDSLDEFIRDMCSVAPKQKSKVRNMLLALKAQWEARAEKKGYERGKGEVNQFLDKMVMNLDEVRKEAVREWSAEKRREVEAIIAEWEEQEWNSALQRYMTLTLKKILALLGEKEGS